MYRDVAEDILSLTPEDLVRLDRNRHIEIALRASIDSMFPFVRKAQAHA